MRIPRIAKSRALYDASMSDRAFEALERAVLNPRDFEEAHGVSITKAVPNIKFARAEEYGAFLAQKSEEENRVNWLTGGAERSIRRKPISDQGANISYLRKAIRKLKSDVGITTRSPSADWAY